MLLRLLVGGSCEVVCQCRRAWYRPGPAETRSVDVRCWVSCRSLLTKGVGHAVSPRCLLGQVEVQLLLLVGELHCGNLVGLCRHLVAGMVECSDRSVENLLVLPVVPAGWDVGAHRPAPSTPASSCCFFRPPYPRSSCLNIEPLPEAESAFHLLPNTTTF